MTILQAPNWTFKNNPIIGDDHRIKPRVFLAGSIEMGAAEKWQDTAGNLLSAAGFCVLNPRRDDWDSTWVQSIDDENFNEQVRWELDGLKYSEAVYVYIDPETKSPITLMELGLLSQLKPNSTFIACPKGFYRRGNIEMLADKYDMFLTEHVAEALGRTIEYLNRLMAGRSILASTGKP